MPKGRKGTGAKPKPGSKAVFEPGPGGPTIRWTKPAEPKKPATRRGIIKAHKERVAKIPRALDWEVERMLRATSPGFIGSLKGKKPAELTALAEGLEGEIRQFNQLGEFAKVEEAAAKLRAIGLEVQRRARGE